MLDACCEGSRITEIIALISAYHCKSHLHVEIRIFSRALGHTAPTRIACYIKHRRESPPHTACRRLYGCHTSSPLHNIRVEGSRKTERNRKHCMESVDDISCHQDRDSETALLHCSLLHSIDLRRVHAVENRAYFSLRSLISHPCTARKLVHLADLLAKSHLLQEVIDLLVYFTFGSTRSQQKHGCSHDDPYKFHLL